MDHDKKRFLSVLQKYDKNRTKNGIGTLNEKSLHVILKNYYDEDISHHEIKLGKNVADIFYDGKIYEIQTGSFTPLIKKVNSYLEDGYDVTVVCPCDRIRYINWIDPESGEVVSRNRSPKRGIGTEFLFELGKFGELANSPKLHFEVLLLDVDIYKLLNGYGKNKKRRSGRVERCPNELIDVIKIKNQSDIVSLLPKELPKHNFKSKDFGKLMKLQGRRLYYTLKLLCDLGIAVRVGKDKNAFVYASNKDSTKDLFYSRSEEIYE